MSEDLTGYVQAELSAHKAVAAGIATFVAVCSEAVALGVLHGIALQVVQAILGAAAVVGVTGSVYQTRAKVLAVRPMPGPKADPHA